MPVVIAGLGCVNPPDPLDQRQLATLAHRYNADNAAQQRLIDRIFTGTRIDQRASVLAMTQPQSERSADHATDRPTDNGAPAVAASPGVVEALTAFYPDPADGPAPTTAQRMRLYERLALPLAADAARAALADAGDDPASITHVISVSCTGFAAPGLEVRLIDALGLCPNVARTCVGFMGCHGAINGLRLAHALAGADPAERVLLVCTELCTLHFQYGTDPQHAVANALFGDGAAACVVRHGDGKTNGQGPPRPAGFCSAVLPDSADLMSWRITDHGFAMTLSPRVPEVVQRRVLPMIGPWLAGHGLSVGQVGGWAVHPGGPKVVTATLRGLGLPDDAGEPSCRVLAGHGNMSSPTVLFILQALARSGAPRPWVALAFGPGLAVEAALIR